MALSFRQYHTRKQGSNCNGSATPGKGSQARVASLASYYGTPGNGMRQKPHNVTTLSWRQCSSNAGDILLACELRGHVVVQHNTHLRGVTPEGVLGVSRVIYA